MTKEQEKLVNDFINETPNWIGSMMKQKGLSGERNPKFCIWCGTNFDNIKELVEIVKELKEKAWMYDDLNK